METKKVLCPIDLSTNSLEAIDVATTMAKAGKGEVIFLHVAMPDLPIESGYAIFEVDAAIRSAQEELSAIRPSDPDVRFRHELRRGDPAAEILRVAKEENVDLIVLTTHGRGGITRLLMGSVAEHVIRKSSCPVISLRTSATVTAAQS